MEKYYNLLQDELASDEDRGPRPVRWLWIDELGSWLLNSDKKTADSIRAKIATILMMGRSRRFFVQTSVQRAQAELFSQGSRDNYSVCLGMGNLTKESASVLGFSRDEFLPITEIGGGHLIMGGRRGCLDSITQATSVPCTIQEKEAETWEKTHDTENIN